MSAPSTNTPSIEKERVSTFVSITRVMLTGFMRDRTALFFTLAMPLIFLLLFGVLTKNAGTSHVKIAEVGQVAVLDSMPGDSRTELEKAVTITKYDDESVALQKVKKGDLDGLVEQGPNGQVVLRFSMSDQVKAGAVQTIVNSVVQQANQAASGQQPKFTLAPSQVEDNSLKAIQYLTPGLLGYAVATGAVFGTSLTLVNWRKRRVLRRLRLAPVSIGSVVAARVAVSVVVAFVQTAIFLVVATMPFFGLKLTGNWWLVLPLVVCATIAFMSIGFLTGAIAKTEEAASGISQIILLPMSFLGGAFIPIDNAPHWLQTVSRALPMRYLVTSAQSVLSKGGGVMDVLPAMGGLLAFAALFTAISWRFFSWDDA
ncbi:ABC transporter permease [Kitasatospora sp. MAP5-34]|uniref:ABC transporter permease n=1 Tax=Kitasatospora sp. MAP5-34 TaxID=3035102 RepID=UPI002474D510|nr:ABC transporter permease [Kitasatospora sp. MAP5-34]MDH6578305.1 ABC-2 type transport system permease protein [Kitasatospora sp. MAP5-34]